MIAEELQTAANEAEESAVTAVDATLNAEEEAAWINLTQDISRCKFGDVIGDICHKLGIKKSQVAAVKCSLPCESLSPADASNMSRDFHHRDHTNPTKPPRSLESCKTPEALAKRNKAILVDRICKSILASFLQDKKDGYKYGMTIENPVGSLRRQPYMQGEVVESALRRTTVDYCAYGKPYRKSTDFWTSYDWTPNGSTGN